MHDTNSTTITIEPIGIVLLIAITVIPWVIGVATIVSWVL